MRQHRGKAGDLIIFGQAAVEQLLTASWQNGSNARIARNAQLASAGGPVDDAHYMERALAQARRAASVGEVPVGAVLVRDGSVVAEAHNLVETTPDALDHAEMLVLREGAHSTGSWRLDAMTLYVTLEPCPMCAGAMALARIARLVYGAPDPRKGAVDSVYDVLRHPANNHRVEVSSGLLSEPSARLLRDFFADRRTRPA
jgi:tRNA(adenine34) deaminase